MAKYGANDFGLLLLRVPGLLMASHGWGKLQWFIHRDDRSVFETDKWAKWVEGVEALGFPEPVVFAWAAVAAELVGGLLVGLGVYTRFAAASVAFTMFVAAFIRHADDAFSAKEKALVYLATCLALVLLGGGRLSVDQLWLKKPR